MHIKKSEMPKNWPIERKPKKKKFIVVPSHAKNKSIPILYIIRDILGYAKTRKEVKRILNKGEIKINNKIRKDDTFPVQVLDTISLENAKKYYSLEIINKKFKLKEISEKDVEKKIVKIIGKTVLPKKSTQMNLEDGNNLIIKEKFNVGDSVILNTKTNKVTKILQLKKGAKIEIILGKHAGKKGELIEIEKLSRSKDYKIKLEDKSEINLPYKAIIVVE